MSLKEREIRIECEGCPDAFVAERTSSGRQARIKSLLPGWSQMGRSDKSPGRLAWWCPACRAAKKTSLTPPDRGHVVTQDCRHLIEQLELMTGVARLALERAERAEASLAACLEGQ